MNTYTKRDETGAVDIEASIRAQSEAHRQALVAWIAENELPADHVRSAVDSILDKHSQDTSNPRMPQVVAEATALLGATNETWGVISKRVHAYVSGQVKAGNLFAVKGRTGGGISRTAPVKK
jgi:predicted metalloendopeptidase